MNTIHFASMVGSIGQGFALAMGLLAVGWKVVNDVGSILRSFQKKLKPKSNCESIK